VKDVTNKFILGIVTRILSLFVSHEGCDVLQSPCPVPTNHRSNQQNKERDMKPGKHPTPSSRVFSRSWQFLS